MINNVRREVPHPYCHREERSDVAICCMRLPRCARNDLSPITFHLSLFTFYDISCLLIAESCI
jgi:hypothetical protein